MNKRWLSGKLHRRRTETLVVMKSRHVTGLFTHILKEYTIFRRQLDKSCSMCYNNKNGHFYSGRLKEELMENRVQTIASREDKAVKIGVIPGHFATNHKSEAKRS